MTNLYYRDAQVALLTYDITNESSFVGIEFWIDELKYKVENENMILFLVGNKCDASDEERKVAKNRAKKFADDNNCLFFETSAKNGYNVEQAFLTLVQSYFEVSDTNYTNENDDDKKQHKSKCIMM